MTQGLELKPSSRTVARHVSLVWVAQLLTMAFQLVYAGVTSRAIDPAGFGAFAVALTVTALGGMLANSGLASAAARRTTEDVQGDRAIATAAIGLGLIVAGAFLVSASSWARLWGNPEATTLIQVLCIGLAIGSYGQALAGMARRLGRMGTWTTATFTSALGGMVMGGWTAHTTREPWSLTVMPVTSSALLSLILLIALRRRALLTTQFGRVGQDLIYGAKSLSSSLLSYVTYGVPTWVMSRLLGASTFGSWNRATVVGQVPLESAATAVTTVIFPKFRWDGRGGEDVRRRWSNLLASAALIVLPLAALVVPAVPSLTRILLGPQWTLAGVMAQWVLAATALNVLNSLLGAALQASNNFRAVWLSQVATLLVMGLAALAIAADFGWQAMAVGYCAAAIVAQVVQVISATRSQLLDSRPLFRWYSIAGGMSLLLASAASAIVATIATPWFSLGAIALIGFLFLGLSWRHRGALHPLRSLLGE